MNFLQSVNLPFKKIEAKIMKPPFYAKFSANGNQRSSATTFKDAQRLHAHSDDVQRQFRCHKSTWRSRESGINEREREREREKEREREGKLKGLTQGRALFSVVRKSDFICTKKMAQKKILIQSLT